MRLFKFVVANGGKVPFLGKVLPDQAVGVFVKPPFPGGVGMGEVNICLKIVGDRLMLGKLLAVVTGYCVDKVPVGSKQQPHLAAGFKGSSSADAADDGEGRLSLYQRDNGRPPLSLFAQDRVRRPVPDAALAINDGRALIDALFVKPAPAVVTAAVALPVGFLATEVP